MARPENARRRVSHLVGRFEQLAKLDIRNSDPLPGPVSPRPASHHGDKPWMTHERRSFSLSALQSPVDGNNQTEREPMRKRHRDLSFAFPPESSPLDETASVYQDAYEDLRSPQKPDLGEQRAPQKFQHRETSSSHDLKKRLKDENEARQTLQVQCAGLQTQVDRLSDKLVQRDESLYQDYELRLVALAKERDNLSAKVEKLKQKLVKRVEDQRAEYSRRITAVSNERDIMASRIRALESEASSPNNSAGEKLRVAEAKAEAAAQKVQTLQNQLQMLKADVAKGSNAGPQTSDQDIASMMSSLNHQLQNWVVNVFRGTKLDPNSLLQNFDKIPELSSHRTLRNLYKDFDTSTKFFVFQATILRILHKRIFEPFFFGLPPSLQTLESVAEILCLSADQNPNTWLTTTLSLLLEPSSSSSAKILETSTAEAQTNLSNDLTSIISNLTDTQLSDQQIQSLKAIIVSAVGLARLLRCQRAGYRVLIPGDDYDCDFNSGSGSNSDCDSGHESESGQDLEFDAETMEDVYGDAGDVVKCVTFPLLLKYGDERGENQHIRNVISKAKVLCFPDE